MLKAEEDTTFSLHKKKVNWFICATHYIDCVVNTTFFVIAYFDWNLGYKCWKERGKSRERRGGEIPKASRWIGLFSLYTMLLFEIIYSGFLMIQQSESNISFVFFSWMLNLKLSYLSCIILNKILETLKQKLKIMRRISVKW